MKESRTMTPATPRRRAVRLEGQSMEGTGSGAEDGEMIAAKHLQQEGTSTASSLQTQVSYRAMLARLRRRLRHDGEILRCCRPNSRDWPRLGDWFLFEADRNLVTAWNVDPGTMARELGLLKPWEGVACEQ